MKIMNHDKEWDTTGEEYQNMKTEIEGFERISYEEKRKKAEAEVLKFVSGCTDINAVRKKIDNDGNVQDKGRTYLEWAVVDAIVDKNEVWWATRTD